MDGEDEANDNNGRRKRDVDYNSLKVGRDQRFHMEFLGIVVFYSFCPYEFRLYPLHI